nr:fumarylacetoacetate hydrolase family protein [Micromonospora sp. DSM 115978]
MTTRVHLVRHGEVFNPEKILYGRLPGFRLSENGERQAKVTAEYLAGADLAPLVPDPPKIVCMGLNYATHLKEMGRTPPTHPTLFAKYSRSLIGPTDDIVVPPVTEEVDWEGELAFVIGTTVRFADAAAAREAIAGYTVMNDV